MFNFVTCKLIEIGPMRLKCIILGLLVCVAMAVSAQPTQQAPEWEWYLDEVVSDMFVGRNYFEYYYMPSASEMKQQRDKGEVTYFLNTPEGLNVKQVRSMIDHLMSSYDDIQTMCGWQETPTTYWKEFRCERNKFRFSVKRKALDDGTYYVSVTENAGYHKSLGKKAKVKDEEKSQDEEPVTVKPVKRGKRDRRAITQEDVTAAEEDTDAAEDSTSMPVMSARERRQAERDRREALKQEERQAKRRAQEERRAQEKAQKEADKQRKAEEKKLKEEEKKRKEEENRLKKEEEKQRREQERQEREQARREKEAARAQAAAPPVAESKYHYSDIALWLSEKYDFTQTVDDGQSCSMYSMAVKDTEMAKLAIKNALKGSNARMAVPWRLNSDTQAVETGYTVDDHVLVFTIGKNDDGNITLTITEVSALELEQFKKGLNQQP